MKCIVNKWVFLEISSLLHVVDFPEGVRCKWRSI